MMEKRKILQIFVLVTIIMSIFSNASWFGPIIMIGKANPGNISENWHNETTLNITVLQLQPRINWYDFQYNNSGTWVSRQNAQIDVNDSAEYRFIINISGDQGWDDVEYINITAWHDNGDESTIYNQTLGGNINLFIQYENTTGTANVNLLWPNSEVTFGTWSETIVEDVFGSPGNTECHNLTFSFIPGYQLRYAPGDGAWDTTEGHNDIWSWNFNITVDNATGHHSYHNPIVGESVNEFGVYSYSDIVTAGWPTITGNPGVNTTADTNITIITRSNGNYSLSVDVDQLNHKTHPTANISNQTVWVRGGDLGTSTNFTGAGPLYFYGSSTPTYKSAEANTTSLTTSDVEYKCDIPLGQQAGDYNATIHYHLRTQT